MNQFADVWFFNRGWKPHVFQKQTWAALVRGQSGVLNAPTGFGKTFAIWFGIIDQYYKKEQPKKAINSRNKLHSLWITPLRALSKEIYKATTQVSADLELDYTVQLRTGDTSVAERKKQRDNPPHALITTPESVHLLLASKGNELYFKDLEFLIVDEWHELLGSKRGVLIELAISRLKALNPRLKVWGISATIGNLEEAKDILLGSQNKGKLIKAKVQKTIRIETVLPDNLERYPWAGHLGIQLLDKVVNIIKRHKTTLVFTNTRSQSEIWYQNIIMRYPEFAGVLAIHHGSLSDEIRQWVEEALHEGRLRAAVCTSSLDLGVDFRPVDCVIQIGSPKGVARFLQRAGRSGHRPDEISYIYYVPTNSLEIIEGDSLKYAVANGVIERRLPYVRSFDVLIQYLMTLAVGDGLNADKAFQEISKTHCYQSVSREEFDECISMLIHGGRALTAYDEFRRLELDAGVYKVASRKLAMRHRLSIGAIVSDSMMRVKFLGGKWLGVIEESFVSKLKVGDVFWFSGRQLELSRIHNMEVIVKSSKKTKGIVPSWMGGRFSISPDLGVAIRHSFQNIQKNNDATEEIRFLRPLFDLQKLKSALPKGNELLVECIRTKYGNHLFLYPFEGKLVHEGMAQVITYRLSLIKPATFSIATNEYGLEILTNTDYEITIELIKELVNPKRLHEDINQGINVKEMAKRRFRDIAGIAGLVFKGFPGKVVNTKYLQANSALFFSVFEEYDSNNLLLRQSYDEVYDFQLEEGRMQLSFQRMAGHRIVLVFPERLTPFAFPIFSESFREKYSNEDWGSRLDSLRLQLEEKNNNDQRSFNQ